MNYKHQNVIELRPYLPQTAAPAVTAESDPDTLPRFAALVESIVTVGIGVCLVIGMIVSLLMMI